MLPWLLLLISGALEIVWAVGMRYTEGFTRPWPSLVTIGSMALSLYLWSLAAKTIPIGTAYAVWTGIGAAGAALFGMLLFNEPRTALRAVCILMILGGVIGLKMSS